MDHNHLLSTSPLFGNEPPAEHPCGAEKDGAAAFKFYIQELEEELS